jgi:hypothetical protein
MDSDSNNDFNVLFKKSYKELGINWLDNLESDDDYMTTIMKDFQTIFPEIKVVNPYMILLKTITFVIQKNSFVLQKSDVYDFFIMSYKFLIDHLIKKQVNSIPFTLSTFDNVVFEICNDFLHTYDTFDKNVKIQFPSLLVDVLSIIFLKSDLDGKKVSLFQLKTYYESKKSSLIKHIYSYPSRELQFLPGKSIKNPKELIDDLNTAEMPSSPVKKTYTAIKRDNTQQSYTPKLVNTIHMTDEMVLRLAQIVQRDPDQVKKSLSILPEKELQKLYDICNNYSKVLRYGKLVGLKDFKTEIESELGRSLSDKQIRHSQISIKKVQFYIVNILDGKFQTHLTHGINHVKHNFEYGYRLVGLINNTKSKKKKNIC